MPGKTSQGGLLAKLGNKAKQAVDKHKNDETDFGGGGKLPAGIEGGIGQLTVCKFDKYKKGANAGQYYFTAAGLVVEPLEHNGRKVQGKRTSVMEPMCDTPGKSRETIEDHIAWVLNFFRMMGVDTADMTADDLESTAAALQEAQPHFGFRTWENTWKDNKTKKDVTRVMETWEGIVEYTPQEPTDEVDDETGGDGDEPADDEAGDSDTAATDDIGDLVGLANGDEDDDDTKAAQARLTELAIEAGMTEKQVEKAKSWAEVGEKIAAAQGDGEGDDDGGDEGDTEAQEPEFEPAKDDVYFYKPKGAKKKIEVEVTAVFKSKRIVNLKNMEDGKTKYDKVSWDDLLQE